MTLDDEEALKEEISRLRTAAAVQHREATEAREKLHKAEEEGWVKDKLLQEMLSQAKSGSGVNGDVLDQLRGELQALLHVKSRHYEARRQLDDTEAKLQAVQQELRVTSVEALMDGVATAKAEAKTKVETLLKSTSSDNFVGQAQQSRETMKELVGQIEEIEGEGAKGQQQCQILEEERGRYEQEAVFLGEQLQRLREQRVGLDTQMEQCRERLGQMESFLTEQESLDRQAAEKTRALVQAREQNQSMEQRCSAMRRGWKVHEDVLAPGFMPLCSGGSTGSASADPHVLLWRFRQALGSSRCSGVQALLVEDSHGDGRLSAEELGRALKKLDVFGCEPQAVQQLVNALDPALVSKSRVSIVDLVLALPLLQRPPAPADAKELREALVWACRRLRKTESEVRGRLLDWLADSSGSLAQASDLAADLGLTHDMAQSIAHCLEHEREQFVSALPSWRHVSSASRSSILLRFLRDFANRRDLLTPLLDSSELVLPGFLELGEQLGPRWSRAELEEVALLAEATPQIYGGDHGVQTSQVHIPRGCLPPIVDGARLVRAAALGGLPVEFPDASRGCSDEARQELEDAAKAKTRKVEPEEPLLPPWLSKGSEAGAARVPAAAQAIAAAAGEVSRSDGGTAAKGVGAGTSPSAASEDQEDKEYSDVEEEEEEYEEDVEEDADDDDDDDDDDEDKDEDKDSSSSSADSGDEN